MKAELSLKLFFVVCFTLLCFLSYSQGAKPRWVHSIPSNNKFVYIRGVGTSSKIEEAKAIATKDIYKQLIEKSGINCNLLEKLEDRSEVLVVNGKETEILKEDFLSSLACDGNMKINGVITKGSYYRRKKGVYEMWVLKAIPVK